VQVSRYAPSGSVVTRVFAHDADFANNARLSFLILPGDDDDGASALFDLDRDLGAVSVAADLRQAPRDRYEVVTRCSLLTCFQLLNLTGVKFLKFD